MDDQEVKKQAVAAFFEQSLSYSSWSIIDIAKAGLCLMISTLVRSILQFPIAKILSYITFSFPLFLQLETNTQLFTPFIRFLLPITILSFPSTQFAEPSIKLPPGRAFLIYFSHIKVFLTRLQSFGLLQKTQLQVWTYVPRRLRQKFALVTTTGLMVRLKYVVCSQVQAMRMRSMIAWNSFLLAILLVQIYRRII